jgi:hypothetical protein
MANTPGFGDTRRIRSVRAEPPVGVFPGHGREPSSFAETEMREFFHCVAGAVVECGLEGLAGMVPGGEYAYKVVCKAYEKYQGVRRERELKQVVVELARANVAAAHEVASQVVLEVAAKASPEERETLELYLTGIPESVRQSLKRKEDPSGTTIPANYVIADPEAVLRLLPPRPPRFRPGMDLPGMEDWRLERLLGIGGFGEVWLARHVDASALSGAVKFCFDQAGRDLIHESELVDRVMSAGEHVGIVPLINKQLRGMEKLSDSVSGRKQSGRQEMLPPLLFGEGASGLRGSRPHERYCSGRVLVAPGEMRWRCRLIRSSHVGSAGVRLFCRTTEANGD